MIIKITPATLLLFIIVCLLLLGIYVASVQTRLNQYEQSQIEDKLMIRSIYMYIDKHNEIDKCLKPHLRDAMEMLRYIKPKIAPQLKENVLGGK